jgi:cation diffusion facilitator family transporter
MDKTRVTVYVALASNVTIALAKGAAGALSGSAAMLAEAAHSLADCTNQILLLVSLSLGERKPDEEHPFGYGKERFFWSFLAAVFIFVSGALFSFAEGGIRIVRGSSGGESWPINAGVLVFAFVVEGASLVRAVVQTRDEAREAGLSYREFIRESRDPTAKFVVFEDAAACVGVVLAFTGVTAETLTGNAAWDGAASIAIGVLLVYLAFRLGADTKSLLIGRAARPEQREALRRTMEADEGIDKVVDLRTMYIGPRSLLVAARIDLADGRNAEDIERMASRVGRALVECEPDVEEVFLDPTHPHESDAA